MLRLGTCLFQYFLWKCEKIHDITAGTYTLIYRVDSDANGHDKHPRNPMEAADRRETLNDLIAECKGDKQFISKAPRQ